MILFFLLLALFFLFLHPINSGDFFHHANNGRYIFEHFSLPYRDTLSFTAFNQPYISYSWFVGSLSYLLYITFGPNAISILHAIFGIVTLFFLFLTLKNLKINSTITLVLILTAGAIISLRYPTRPEILSSMFTSILIYLITKYQRLNYLFPILFWFWGVSYGSSTFLGILILAAFIMYKRDFSWKNLILFVTSIIASLANGYGLKTILFIFQIPAIAPHDGEWLPLFQTLHFNVTLSLFFQYLIPIYLTFVAFYLILIVFAVTRFRKVLISNLFLFLLSLSIFAPFVSNRLISITPILVMPILAIIINQMLIFRKIFLAFFVLLTLASFYVTINYSTFGLGLDEGLFPIKEVEFLKSNQISGNIYSNLELGDFLSFSLPLSKVFIDTRDDLYQPLGIFGELQDLYGKKITLLYLLNKYKATIVIGDFANPIVYKPLFYNTDWKLVFVSDNYFILVKNDIKQRNNLFSFDALDLFKDPPAKGSNFNETERELERLIKENPNFTESKVWLIQTYLADGKSEKAKAILQNLMQAKNWNSQDLLVMLPRLEIEGRVFLEAKNCKEAFAVLTYAEKLTYHKLFFSPKARIPSKVDKDLGTYYLVCKKDINKASDYFSRYLNQNPNPIERLAIEQQFLNY